MRMKSLSGLGAMMSAMPMVCCARFQQHQAGGAGSVALTQTVHTRTEMSSDGPRGEENVSSLLMSSGGPNEPPEGPSAFDVTSDGRFLITDPLRLTSVNSAGARKGNLAVVHYYDLNEKERSARASLPETEKARPAGVNRAVIALACSGPMTFVALEATPEGATVEITKYVRRYGVNSRLISETSGLPLDHYVRPVNEIHIRNGNIFEASGSAARVIIYHSTTWSRLKAPDVPLQCKWITDEHDGGLT